MGIGFHSTYYTPTPIIPAQHESKQDKKQASKEKKKPKEAKKMLTNKRQKMTAQGQVELLSELFRSGEGWYRFRSSDYGEIGVVVLYSTVVGFVE